MINVGLIGFGLAGRAFHAQVISRVPGLRLAAILQRKGDEAAVAYPDAKIVRSLEELLALPEIQLVVIASPNETHAPLAHAAMAAGRDVVVDKPFTTSYAEAVDLVNFAEKSRRFLTVYQNRRYDGDFQAIRELVSAGTLGRIVRFETCYDRFRPNFKPNAWREKAEPGAGILFDIGPHVIDHAMVLFGLPEAITADVRIERQGGLADDAFDIMFHYPNSLRAVLSSNILAVIAAPTIFALRHEGRIPEANRRSAGKQFAVRQPSRKRLVGCRVGRELGIADALRWHEHDAAADSVGYRRLSRFLCERPRRDRG